MSKETTSLSLTKSGNSIVKTEKILFLYRHNFSRQKKLKELEYGV